MRAARLAEQKAALKAELAAMEKFGHHEEFLARLVEIVEAPERTPGEATGGHPVADGTLGYFQLGQFARWHRPRVEKGLPSYADAASRHHPLPVIVDFRDQLLAHRIELLVVAVPSRIEIYPELLLELPTLDGFAGMGIGTVRFLAQLNEAGVETLDLRPSFVASRFGLVGDREDQLFFRTDTHWSPRGAELAAVEVGARVASLPWFVRGPLQEGRDFLLERRTIVFAANVDRVPSRRPETVEATLVRAGDGPFDRCSDRSRFVVVGDSFTAILDSWGADFTTHLARTLGHRLDLVQTDGDAASEGLRKLALWNASRWKSRKLVIWCLSAQSLGCDPKWEKVAVFHE